MLLNSFARYQDVVDVNDHLLRIEISHHFLHFARKAPGAFFSPKLKRLNS
jgi:hypothetical protein